MAPRVKKNIKALVQWVKDMVRMSRNPANERFPIADAAKLIKRYNTHKDQLSKATDKVKTAKPKQFTQKTKWIDWCDSFVNFLHTQPRRNGVPLSYVIHNSNNPIIRENAKFLNDYIDQAQLYGDAFASDASKVHTFIISFITENETAENKIMPYLQQNNGRTDYQLLRDHYEGVSATTKAIVKSEEDLTNMFSASEKKPHIWWDEFEMRLTVALATIDRHEGRQVYSD